MSSNPNEIPHGDQLRQSKLALLTALNAPHGHTDAQAIDLICTFEAALTDHHAALIASSAKDAHCDDDRDLIGGMSDAMSAQGTQAAEMAMKARQRAQGQSGTND